MGNVLSVPRVARPQHTPNDRNMAVQKTPAWYAMTPTGTTIGFGRCLVRSGPPPLLPVAVDDDPIKGEGVSAWPVVVGSYKMRLGGASGLIHGA